MGNSRNGKFVIPKKPAAGSGWWVGRVINGSGSVHKLNKDHEIVLCKVHPLWVENRKSSTDLDFSAEVDELEEVGSEEAGKKKLRLKGVIVDAE